MGLTSGVAWHRGRPAASVVCSGLLAFNSVFAYNIIVARVGSRYTRKVRVAEGLLDINFLMEGTNHG